MISRRLDRNTVYWVPSKTAVTGMLALGGFEILAERTGTMHEFIAAIARNVKLDEVTDAPGLIPEQLASGMRYPEFHTNLPEESSSAEYRGPQNDVVINDKKYEPDFPPHPTKPKPAVGSSFHKGGV